mmetsp:Transcript_52845/g.53250  ORF Transcript_52845/g.53250 Transcript_52845/m.53250 type:complete len:87 (+) Transcript_52845:3-263(+)
MLVKRGMSQMLSRVAINLLEGHGLGYFGRSMMLPLLLIMMVKWLIYVPGSVNMAYNIQTETCNHIWNFRGLGNNSWFRKKIDISKA